MPHRTALLLRCANSEAAEIRQRASQERRSISGYVLHIAIRAADFDVSLSERSRTLFPYVFNRPPEERTSVLIHCSLHERAKIRRAAQTRDTTISGFVLTALRRSWRAAEQIKSLQPDRMLPLPSRATKASPHLP